MCLCVIKGRGGDKIITAIHRDLHSCTHRPTDELDYELKTSSSDLHVVHVYRSLAYID